MQCGVVCCIYDRGGVHDGCCVHDSPSAGGVNDDNGGAVNDDKCGAVNDVDCGGVSLTIAWLFLSLCVW